MTKPKEDKKIINKKANEKDETKKEAEVLKVSLEDIPSIPREFDNSNNKFDPSLPESKQRHLR